MSRLPRDSWQEAWSTAAGLAVAALQSADPPARCADAGARWQAGANAIEVPLLGRHYCVGLPGYQVRLVGQEEPVPLPDCILVLHYLQMASGSPLEHRWISFSDVPGGELYLGKFRARSVDRLVRTFGGRESELVPAAAPLGGRPGEWGDVSVIVPALPRVPLALVLHAGDDEFPADGSILFDASVSRYLPAEDMVVLAAMAVSRLGQPGGGTR
jgi:hypothetical protein